MTLELASVRAVRKPWGKTDLRPWSELGHDGAPIGELWFQRADAAAPEPALLLKLLFTDQALSIQVHPDDAFAQAIGLPHGKTEAWYVLAAEAGAEISLGLRRPLTALQLRAAIVDGSIADITLHHPVHPGETIAVPAGTIHAIGAGLVIAEIQQRSDTTFRLFDYGSGRELHLDSAVGAARAEPAPAQAPPERLSEARLVVTTSPYFTLEQVDLPAHSDWELEADRETWLLLVAGSAQFNQIEVTTGEAVFIDAQRIKLRVGDSPVKGLMAYVGGTPIAALLQSRDLEPEAPPNGRFAAFGKVRELNAPLALSGRGIRP